MADTENNVRHEEDELRGQLQSEAQTGEFDKDVNISGIVWTGVILTGITALSFVLMWWMFAALKSYQEAKDPRPMPIEEAEGPIEPPGPELQSTPEEDLRRMREQEEALLESYSLIEGEEGYARIPVDEALDLFLGPAFDAGGDGMSSPGEAVEAPGTPDLSGSDVGGEEAGTSTAGSANPGTPSHSPESTRSR